MPRTLLVVDDVETNRRILKRFLSEDYNILEAKDGLEAMQIMMRNYKMLSAVLLDLSMPEMDGYEVLRQMRSNAALSIIPVIVMTGDKQEQSEVLALKMGAMDYISKPYNVGIVKQRLHNMINLRENAATVNALQRDKLTGLYNREAFYEKVSGVLKTHLPGYYVLSCFDIDNFKVINDQYGSEKGDAVLKFIGGALKRIFEPRGAICCRMTADNYAILCPGEVLDTPEVDDAWKQAAKYDGSIPQMTFSIGRYLVSDLTLSVAAMYDRACIAKASIKGRFDAHVALYSETMRSDILHEQEIVNDMNRALEQEQFELWLQPQFNHSTGALIGAEALVRWRHPEKGLMAPNRFISVFERNGFIYELDKYIWKKSCQKLRKWIDEGRRPLPVSVNISRYDVLRNDFFQTITGLVEKYSLDVGLLRLEITESAFAVSAKRMIDVVKRLIDYGFTIEIDDFGSGYSSLNTLKDVPATVLKLDMRFLESSDDTRRGGNILESVVRMAKWLGMSVIAEGVEIKEQADYLESIGCSYIQGYLYYRPMPADMYEKLAKSVGKEQKMLSLETVANLDNNMFWDPKSMDTLIFNSYVGGACILEFHNGKIEILRANEKYARVIGNADIPIEDALRINWMDHLDADGQRAVMRAFNTAKNTGEEVTDEFVFLNLPGCPVKTYLRSSIKVIASSGDRYLAYCTNENITSQRVAEEKERESAQKLKRIMDNFSNGVTVSSIRDGKVIPSFVNDRFYKLIGYSKDDFDALDDPFEKIVHPLDARALFDGVKNAMNSGEGFNCEFRIIRGDGRIIWVSNDAVVTKLTNDGDKVLLSVISDITAVREAENARKELLDNLPCGAALFKVDALGAISVLSLNRRFTEITKGEGDIPKSAIIDKSVHPEDREVLSRVITFVSDERRDVECDLRILCGDGAYRGFHMKGRGVPGGDGERLVYATFNENIDDEIAVNRALPYLLKAIMRFSTDIAFAKDRFLRYICASDGFLKTLGITNEKLIVGKKSSDVYGKKLSDDYDADDKTVMESGKALVNMVKTFTMPDGEPHYIVMSKYPLKDAVGNIVGLYCVGRDITRDRETYEQLKLLTDNIPGGLATYKFIGNRYENIYFSDGFCKLFGYTRDEYEKLSSIDPVGRVFKEDLPELSKKLSALSKDATPVECVYRIHVKDGSYKWIKHRGVVTAKGDGISIVTAALFDVTDEYEVNEKVRRSEEEYRLAIKNSGEVCFRYDVAGRFIDVSPEAVQIFGCPERITDLSGGLLFDKEASPDADKAINKLFSDIDSGSETGSMTLPIIVKNGEQRFFEMRYSTVFASGGKPLSAIILLSDITQLREKESVFIKWRQSFAERDASEYSVIRHNLTRNGAVRQTEGALVDFGDLTGFVSFDECMLRYASARVHPEDRAAYLDKVDMDGLLGGYYRGVRNIIFEYRQLTPNGVYHWVRANIDLVEYPDTTDIEAYIVYEDIDDSKRAELLTIERAETDPLTGLLNRSVFTSRARARMRVSKPETRHAFMILDVDGFKAVNDAFGHAAGDEALVEIASSLRSILRSSDLIGRLGGDEFVLFLGDISSEEAAGSKARQICAAVRKSFSLDISISASIGIVLFPQGGRDFDELYKKADAALYSVKSTGKDAYAFYSEEKVQLKPIMGNPTRIS